MDPTNCLDRILAAYACDDFDEFSGAANDLQQWHDRGGFLPLHLQSFADDLQAGAPCYDTDHRGEIGAATVTPHDEPADIRQLVIDAFAEALESATTTFSHCGTWRS